MGKYRITCQGAVDPNYTFSYSPAALTIGPAALSITASSPHIVYGTRTPRIHPIYSGLASWESGPTALPRCKTKAPTHSAVGRFPTSCSGAADSNYAITYHHGSLEINPAPLKIKATSLSLPYGHHLPHLSWTANFVKGDRSTSLAAQPKCTTSALLDSTRAIVGPAGKYTIACAGAAARNYVMEYQPGTLTVTLARVGLKYAGDRSLRVGQAASLSAYLFATKITPIVGRTISFTLGAGATAQVCTSTVTDTRGYGSCTIDSVQQPQGEVTITMRFAGDPAGPTHDYALGKSSLPIVVRK